MQFIHKNESRQKMMRFIFFIVILIFHSLAWASDDYLAIANEAVANKNRQIARYREDGINALKRAENIMNENKMTTENQGHHKKYPAVIVFVSFSMPKESLRAYLYDARIANASVAVRGLHENSFKKTFTLISTLIHDNGGNGVELNPILFKKFDIKTAPTIVALSNDDCLKKPSCDAEKDYDKLSGNIALAYALKILRDRGKVGTVNAEVALNKLQGGHRA